MRHCRFAALTGLLAVLALTGTSPSSASAQGAGADSTGGTAPTHMLRTRDGATMIGRLVGETADTVRFQTPGGMLVLSRTSVAELRRIDPRNVHHGEYWPADPHATRLFFAPTGRTMKKRETYFSDTYLFFLDFVTGVTDRITMGGGFSVFPSSDFSNNVFYLEPKVGVIQGEDFNVSVGALVGFAGKESGSAGILYGMATKGGPDLSLSAGAGWGYFKNKVGSQPMVMIGGAARVSRRISLMSENYVFSGDANHALLSYGVRIMGERLSVDLAFLNVAGGGDNFIFPGVPFLAFATKF